MVAQLVPERLTGFLMGAWFMAVAIGMILGGMVASLTDIPSNLPVGMDSLNIYSNIFLKIGIVTTIIAIVMALMTPKLKNLMSK
jgi:POT family proton-dependent oligopeptide transporter